MRATWLGRRPEHPKSRRMCRMRSTPEDSSTANRKSSILSSLRSVIRRSLTRARLLKSMVMSLRPLRGPPSPSSTPRSQSKVELPACKNDVI
eukprot:43442-Pyramimonas_sp.AAC.1